MLSGNLKQLHEFLIITGISAFRRQEIKATVDMLKQTNRIMLRTLQPFNFMFYLKLFATVFILSPQFFIPIYLFSSCPSGIACQPTLNNISHSAIQGHTQCISVTICDFNIYLCFHRGGRLILLPTLIFEIRIEVYLFRFFLSIYDFLKSFSQRTCYYYHV